MSLLPKKNSLKLSDAAEIEAPDVDVTPMMNILIILLVLLISMAVFTRISMLSFSLPPNVGTGLAPDGEKPKLKMTIVIAPQYCALTYGETMLDSVPLSGNDNDFLIIKDKILKRKETMDLSNEAVVAVRDKVRFQNMVKVMDICRESGFDKIGVSSATENAENGV
jgi:biopolymer transport protein ExbD